MCNEQIRQCSPAVDFLIAILSVVAWMGLPLGISGVNAQVPAPIDYYVSEQNGNDASGEGTQLNPWKTIARLQTAISSSSTSQVFNTNLPPGSTINFERDGRYPGSLVLDGIYGDPVNSESYDGWVRIQPYGIGEDPVITGADTFSSWTDEDENEVALPSNVWASAVPAGQTVYNVYFGETMGIAARYPDVGWLRTEGDLTGTQALTCEALV